MNIRKKSNKQLLKRLDQLPGAIYEYQEWPDGRSAFPYASRTIEKILFVTPKELAKDGSKAWEFVSRDYREPLREILARSPQDEFEFTFSIQPPQKGVRNRKKLFL